MNIDLPLPVILLACLILFRMAILVTQNAWKRTNDSHRELCAMLDLYILCAETLSIRGMLHETPFADSGDVLLDAKNSRAWAFDQLQQIEELSFVGKFFFRSDHEKMRELKRKYEIALAGAVAILAKISAR